MPSQISILKLIGDCVYIRRYSILKNISERLSTVAATKSLIAADVSRKKRKKVIDKMAAVFILQGYLDGLSAK